MNEYTVLGACGAVVLTCGVMIGLNLGRWYWGNRTYRAYGTYKTNRGGVL